VGIFEGVEQAVSGGTTPATPDPTMFGVAFWLAFTMHVALGEWWLPLTDDSIGRGHLTHPPARGSGTTS